MTHTLEVKRNKHDEIESIIITDGDNSNPLGPIVMAKINPNLLDEAEFILRACNAHYDMLEALKLCEPIVSAAAGLEHQAISAELDTEEFVAIAEQTRAAIAKAKANED